MTKIISENRVFSAKQKLCTNEFAIGVVSFFARLHRVDMCGSNGLPLTPNSITINGKSQILKALQHPNLCQYLDIIRGKHERLLVVSQYCGTPLGEKCSRIPPSSIPQIAFGILQGLDYLHQQNIVLHNLCPDNILLQEDGSIKLFNFGMYNMTNYGQLVSFPLTQTLYSAPEVYLDRNNRSAIFAKSSDIWSLGMILAELVMQQPLWQNLKIGHKIRKILSLMQSNGRAFERIAHEHKCYETFKCLESNLKILIEHCLVVNPEHRKSAKQLLENPLFDTYKDTSNSRKINLKFEPFTIREFYHWWQLSRGDAIAELKKEGLIRNGPPILSLPSLMLIDGTTLGQEKNPTTLYDQRVLRLSTSALYERFSHLKHHHFYPLIHSTSPIIERFDAATQYDASGLPLCIKEKDPEYQFHRIILFRRLLFGYPFTRELIVKQSQFDIPPLMRGDIWAALLHISGDPELVTLQYQLIDKETQTATDRQIEVDIPRCHQYNELLSSAEGHRKLKRVLKAWVQQNADYVYWQGLDSLTAPFLLLHFNNEACAFACLSAFVPKYLHKFFLKDNSVIIKEYLARFSQLIAFHDPRLANHLHDINFIPELFAIPWFLTMFSHVFPLHKIFHLWDKLLLGDSSFPLHIGLSVLSQLRSRLMSSGFNECILLFSDLPEVDIENCVKSSTLTYETTPKSITYRLHDKQNVDEINEERLEESKAQNKKRFPNIFADDVENLALNYPSQLIAIDTRNPTQYSRRSLIGSYNIPISSVKFGETSLDSLGHVGKNLSDNLEKIVVIIGDCDTDVDMFPRFLLECNVPKVCILNGGFEALMKANNSIFIVH